jgi:hypothetical protein
MAGTLAGITKPARQDRTGTPPLGRGASTQSHIGPCPSPVRALARSHHATHEANLPPHNDLSDNSQTIYDAAMGKTRVTIGGQDVTDSIDLSSAKSLEPGRLGMSLLDPLKLTTKAARQTSEEMVARQYAEVRRQLEEHVLWDAKGLSIGVTSLGPPGEFEGLRSIMGKVQPSTDPLTDEQKQALKAARQVMDERDKAERAAAYLKIHPRIEVGMVTGQANPFVRVNGVLIDGVRSVEVRADPTQRGWTQKGPLVEMEFEASSFDADVAASLEDLTPFVVIEDDPGVELEPGEHIAVLGVQKGTGPIRMITVKR